MSTTENREGNPEGFEDSDLIETYLDGETVYRGSFFNVEKVLDHLAVVKVLYCVV